MQHRKLAIVIALSTLSAGTFAAGPTQDALVRAGTVQPVPQAAMSSHSPSRAEVQAQAGASIPLSRDSIVAEGLRARPTPSTAMASRDAVRTEAMQASRASYTADARISEGS